MTIDLYHMTVSSPCRAVRMTARAVGVDLNLKATNLQSGDQLKPEYIKMNPQHTIPTINDDGFCLWESRAIQSYLVEKYGKTDTLYPNDLQKRTIVNQRLFFDQSLYQRYGDVYYPMLMNGARKDPEKCKKMEEAFGFLETFLGESKYAAGDDITIADHSLMATMSTVDVSGAIDLSKYPNIKKWFEDCKKSIDGYQELNGSGVKLFGWYVTYKKFTYALKRPFLAIIGR